MLHFSKSNRVMESETILKNGESLKSHMSRVNFRIKSNKGLKRMLIWIFGLIIISSSVNAQTVEKREDNSDFALELYNTGAKYEKGKGGVKQNTDSAILWYSKAAARQYLPAVEKLKKWNITVYCKKLRYNWDYTFNETWNNNGDHYTYIWGVNVKSKEQYDYNKSPDFPKFRYTEQINEQEGVVKPFQDIKIFESETKYWVAVHPPQRAYDNLLLIYTITYSYDKEGKNKKQKQDYVYYEITWCGDGILDTDHKEECDDGNKIDGDGCDCNCKKE